jgi:hypothetical protein
LTENPDLPHDTYFVGYAAVVVQLSEHTADLLPANAPVALLMLKCTLIEIGFVFPLALFDTNLLTFQALLVEVGRTEVVEVVFLVDSAIEEEVVTFVESVDVVLVLDMITYGGG